LIIPQKSDGQGTYLSPYTFLDTECAKPCYSYRARRARHIGVYGGRATDRSLRLFPTL